MNKLQTWNTLPYTLKLSGLFLQYQKFCMAVDALDLEVSQFSGCLGFSLLLMKILGAILEWQNLFVELQQLTLAKVLSFGSSEKQSVFVLHIPCFLWVHLLHNTSMHTRATSRLATLCRYSLWRLHSILSCTLQQTYTSSADQCYAKNLSWRNHLPHTEPGSQTLQIFPKQPAACTLSHPSEETCQSVPFPCFIGFGSFDSTAILSNFSLLGGRSISNWKWEYNSLLSYR